MSSNQIIMGIGIAWLFIYLINKFNEWREARKERQENEEKAAQSQELLETIEKVKEEKKQREEEVIATTRNIMKTSLESIGCQPATSPDGSMQVMYQGERFHIEFGGRYARIWDPAWSSVKKDDPELYTVKEAVNWINFDFGPTVVMTNPSPEGIIVFHSQQVVMLHPECPENTEYIQQTLNSFFDTHNDLRERFHALTNAQTEARANRRPVGFATNTTKNDEEQN